MNSHSDDIKISYLLHKLIYQSERDLKNVSNLPFFYQKAQLAQKLLFSRVRFARFLVIYRWLKCNPYTNNYSKPNLFLYENYFHNIKNQVKAFQKQAQQNSQYFYNLKQQFNDQFNISQQIQKFYSECYNQKNLFQFFCLFFDSYKENTHIQKIYILKKYVYVNAHPYYQLILKVKKQIFKIIQIKLKWEKNLTFPFEYIKELTLYLKNFNIKKPNELSRIDSFLFSFYIICFFCRIVKKLIEISKSFYCQILREADNTVIIIFPKTFLPFNEFILRINQKTNNIEIFSKRPLFHPPKDPRTINETFEKLDVDVHVPMKIYNRIIDTSKNFNGDAFLSELHELVFYTSVRHFWIFLKKEMRSVIFPNFQIVLKCNSESIYFISIHFIDKPDRLLTIIFQSKDGLPIFIPISNFYKLDVQQMFPDAKKIFTSMFIQYVGQIDFSYIFKSHALFLIRKFELIDYINHQINFSFSDHFFLVKRNLLFYPTLTLRSIDNPENLNPRTMLVKQFIKSYENFTNISVASKIFLILLEIERKLKLKGITSNRTLNVIYIPLLGCKFKIDINEYWSICFEKPLIHGVSNGRVIITGNKLSLRFVDSILNIMTDWYRFGLLIYMFRHCLVYTDDNNLYLKSFGYHFYIIYDPFYFDYFLDGHLTHCFKVFPFRYPSFNMKVMMYTPFSNYAQYLNNEDDISSYFFCSIYYQLKISQIFDSEKWKVIPFNGEESFTLVYENQLSMVFHMSNDDFHLIAYVFIIGYSSLLLVPLGRLFPINENKSPIVTIKMPFFDLEKVKLEIEKYDELIKSFKLMKIDHLFYNKGKVIGKGTRFYLIQAVLDSNGIIISSPSFPSLIKITESFYNLNISFNSKKRIYNFILSILLFDDKIIVETLNLLKELVEPRRIHKLNWEEMSNFMKINSTESTLEFLIIEDQEKIFIIFDDPISESVLVIKNGRKKRFESKEFDDIYLHMNPKLPISFQFDV